MKRFRPDYSAGLEYWKAVDASVDGVLGGFGLGTLPRVDALGTRTFLLTVMPALSTITPPHREQQPRRRPPIRALDCGAGIGRVTADVLIHLADMVDLVEPAPHFLAAARTAAPNWRGIADGRKAVRLFECGLQQFDPTKPLRSGQPTVVGPYDRLLSEANDEGEGIYDLIQIQCDTALVAFLKKAKAALRPNDDRESLICVKENTSGTESDQFDEDDSSITRSDDTFRRLFQRAGLRLVKTQLQEGFASELLPVRMYALRP